MMGQRLDLNFNEVWVFSHFWTFLPMNLYAIYLKRQLISFMRVLWLLVCFVNLITLIPTYYYYTFKAIKKIVKNEISLFNIYIGPTFNWSDLLLLHASLRGHLQNFTLIKLLYTHNRLEWQNWIHAADFKLVGIDQGAETRVVVLSQRWLSLSTMRGVGLHSGAYMLKIQTAKSEASFLWWIFFKFYFNMNWSCILRLRMYHL